MLLLERLSLLERAAFLLHDVLDLVLSKEPMHSAAPPRTGFASNMLFERSWNYRVCCIVVKFLRDVVSCHACVMVSVEEISTCFVLCSRSAFPMCAFVVN